MSPTPYGDLAKSHAQGAWARWLSSNVKFTVDTAENYMNAARLRKNFRIDFEVFSRLGPTDLYLIAKLPNALIKRLAKDPRRAHAAERAKASPPLADGLRRTDVGGLVQASARK